jgi:N-hydroxyarylamine O-acetyltransferase
VSVSTPRAPRTLAPSHPRTFDLAAYLSRIGWQGSLEPSLETLTGLTRAHITRIPFENVDVLLGRGIRIDLDSITSKLVVARRGGYCFEHGTLFHAVLEQLGFTLTAHAARVVVIVPKHQSPRTHMFLTVDVDGERFVVDPGFGGHTALVPVPLREGAEVRDGSDRHRMVRHEGEWVLEAEVEGRMTPLWTATLEPQLPIDFQLANHWVSTASASPFVNRLMLRALTPSGRTSVMNRDVTLVNAGKTEKYQLADRQALRALLGEDFGFDLPEVETLRVPMVPEWS